MKNLSKLLLILPLLFSPLFAVGYTRNITQENVSSYDDVIDNYRKLYEDMFAGREDLLMITVTPEQLAQWKSFITNLSDYIGDNLTARYLSSDKPLRRALQLPEMLKQYNETLTKAGLTSRDIRRTNFTIKSLGALNSFLNSNPAKPEWIQETILEPLEGLIKDFEVFVPDEKTPQAALATIARGLQNNWTKVKDDLEELQKNYGPKVK